MVLILKTRDTRYFEDLSEKTSHVDPKNAKDCYFSHNLIDPARNRQRQRAPHTYTVSSV